MRFNLCVPFSEKDSAKQFKPKWDDKLKSWYYVGESLPEGLKKYIQKDVFIEYDEKDECKKLFPSMKWNAFDKNWSVSLEDYKTFLEWRDIKK